MGGVELLRKAREAGLTVEAVGDKLRIRGSKRLESLVLTILDQKAEVMPILTPTAIYAPAGRGDTVDVDRNPPDRTNSGFVSTATLDWAEPDDPGVQATRREAERLGVPGKSARDLNAVEAARAAWIVGPKLDRLPEPVQGLVCRHDGWTPQHWADYLNCKAQRCEELHADLAGRYRLAARLIGRGGHRT